MLAYFWFFSYLSLMSILMINILVGLIFEAYGRIRSTAGEPETLLEQVGDAVETLKDTKGFLDMPLDSYTYSNRRYIILSYITNIIVTRIGL